MKKYVVGFDIGGTKTLALLLSVSATAASDKPTRDDVTVVASLRRPRPTSREQTISQITSMAAELAESSGVSLEGVGIGIAGAISQSGEVLFSPNIPELFDFDLNTILSKEMAVAVAVDNDATAATVAEHLVGSAVGVEHVLYVALGTGIGTSMVLDGKIYRGANGLAGESGHMVIDRNGEEHITGVKGPWEKYASGSGLGELARNKAREGELQSLGALVASEEAIANLRGEHITAALLDGNTEAEAVLDLFVDDIATGLTNLIYILDPELIVIGGGIASLGNILEAKLATKVSETTLGRQYRPGVDLKVSVLGTQAGAIGAGLLAYQQFQRR